MPRNSESFTTLFAYLSNQTISYVFNMVVVVANFIDLSEMDAMSSITLLIKYFQFD